ncbi:MAG TPA: hypothetical protein PLS53_16865 [Thermoanaerobaculaceae bacterium]|nr:hypothetical protein [Thermoanaerobaculaceae bacterium]HPS79834.1 hypothetical protein [Thermoanaerobaculaceae bacterium]
MRSRRGFAIVGLVALASALNGGVSRAQERVTVFEGFYHPG